MSMSDPVLEQLKKQLRIDEGLRLEVYSCSTGHKTIGYGHMDDRLPADTVWTLEQAEQELDKDARYALAQAEKVVGTPTWVKLSDTRKCALANMAYQMGGTGLGKFQSMLSAIKCEHWSFAAYHAIDSLWAKQTPARACRVVAMIREG
jgi:lysozyme